MPDFRKSSMDNYSVERLPEISGYAVGYFYKFYANYFLKKR